MNRDVPAFCGRNEEFPPVCLPLAHTQPEIPNHPTWIYELPSSGIRTCSGTLPSILPTVYIV